MNEINAIIFILSNRSMFGSPVPSTKLRQILAERFDIKLSDVELRAIITEIPNQQHILIGGTKGGFAIAETAEEAREIIAWRASRIKPLIEKTEILQEIAKSRFGEYQQLNLLSPQQDLFT